MRPHPSLVFFLAMPCLVAQDPWAAVDLAVRQQCRPDQFGLVVTRISRAGWIRDIRLLREIQIVLLPKEAPGALPAPLQNQGWALYAPGGKRLAEGTGQPEAAPIRSLMEKAGWRPLQEGLRAYLREHPEDGEAWSELVNDLVMEAVQSRDPLTRTPKPPEALRSDLAWALEGFHGVWSRSPGLLLTAFSLIQTLKPREDPVLTPAWKAWTESAAEQFARDPARFDLFSWALDLKGEALEGEPLYQTAKGVEPLPGVPWPPFSYATLVQSRHEEDPAALAKETGAILDTLLAPEWIASRGQAHVLNTLTMWGPWRVQGLIRKGDQEGALDAIARFRTQAGQGWKGVASQIRSLCFLEPDARGEAVWARITPLSLKDRAALQKALAEPPPPDPETVRIPPLRAAVLGPADPLAWARLQIDRQLKAWSPDELVWTPLGREEAKALAATLGAGPRWVILRGDRMLATGVRMSADDLAAALRSQAVPRLEALDTFIRTHPDRLDARRERMGLIRHRLPDPDLEPRFLEDAVASRNERGKLDFEPKGDAWRRAAATQCAHLAEDLSHWSSNPLLWPAYIQWSALDPAAPRPADLLRGLSIWPYKWGTPLSGPLWEPTLGAATGALAQGRRHGELDAFMEVVWEGGLRTFLEDRGKTPEGPGGSVRSHYELHLGFLRTSLAQWGEALRALPDPRRLKEVQSRLELIQPGLSSLLTRPSGKP